MRIINWDKTADKLFKWSRTKIRQFAREHPDDTICFFSFDTEPCYGYVNIAFDTPANSIQSQQKMEAFAIEQRAKYMTSEDSWRRAKYGINAPVLNVFNADSGDFVWPDYAMIEFSQWQRLAESGKSPKGREHEDDYLEGNVRILLWKVIERLIEENCFQVLKLASPFMIGYGFHDEEGRILRILNWPQY